MGVASGVGSPRLSTLQNFSQPTLQDDLLHAIMAFLQLTVPMKVMTMTFLISFMFFLSVKTGFSMKQTGVCRPFCTGSDCITVNQDRVDFHTAEEACRDSNGELMTFQSETDENTFDILSRELSGNFWIGLCLPAAACSNLSAPQRGYEWTSVTVHRSYTPSSSIWKDNVKVCSPRCVSIASDKKWTERLCSDKTDGFLCKTKHKDACQTQKLSVPNVVKSSAGCSVAPCQHTCTDVKGGYICSCRKGFILDSKKPGWCKLHCAQQKCPVICERNTDDGCYCPEGFVMSDAFCEDINECSSDACDHECENTLGSFVCSCRKGYALKNQVNCIKAEDSQGFVPTTPVVTGLVKPATNNDTLKGSSLPADGFLWIWILLVVAVVVIIVGIRFYVVKRQKRREQNSTQQCAAPVENIEC
ncbi:complement component C1q receptor [Centropristis striata]|uniref:complement component C1q receptor n=1 Tax=Centropristis striata TaxID=184440 RepID=UPI0027E057A1|nr:complement component C1q receptor [Centropristis striata]